MPVRSFNTPEHHRIHHASNPEYIDKNFAGVLIVFDRWFGTFQERIDGVTLRYGLGRPLETYNPLRVGLDEWFAMGRELLAARTLRQCWDGVFGPPRTHAPPLSRNPSTARMVPRIQGLDEA